MKNFIIAFLSCLFKHTIICMSLETFATKFEEYLSLKYKITVHDGYTPDKDNPNIVYAIFHAQEIGAETKLAIKFTLVNNYIQDIDVTEM